MLVVIVNIKQFHMILLNIKIIQYSISSKDLLGLHYNLWNKWL